jgi:hypothetical protein
LTFQHRAGVNTYTSPRGFADICVFGKQSLGPIHCSRSLSKTFVSFQLRHPLFRSYGIILPNSLTKVLPRVLEFSSCLPVSVWGTGALCLDSVFSWLPGVSCFSTSIFDPHQVSASWEMDLPLSLPAPLDMLFLPHAQLSLQRQHFSQTTQNSFGMSTGSPSPTPFGLSLGPD